MYAIYTMYTIYYMLYTMYAIYYTRCMLYTLYILYTIYSPLVAYILYSYSAICTCVWVLLVPADSLTLAFAADSKATLNFLGGTLTKFIFK